MPKNTKKQDPKKVDKTVSEYVKTKKQIEVLTNSLKEQQPKVIKYLSENGGKAEHDGKNISLQTNKKYFYSKEVSSMELVYKNKKKEEEADGTAECVLSTTVVVKDKK